MTFAVTSETTESYKPVSDITWPILAEYCDRHGYTFISKVVTDPVRDVVWDRVLHLQDALKTHDWAVHVDADWCPTNLKIKLESIIENDKSVVIATAKTKGNEIVFNDGFLAVKDSIFGVGCLSYCWKKLNRPEEKIFCLQDALQELYTTGGEVVRNGFRILPQRAVNSFDYREYNMPETTGGQWEAGDFAIHYPGRTIERRVELLTKILPEIRR